MLAKQKQLTSCQSPGFSFGTADRELTQELSQSGSCCRAVPTDLHVRFLQQPLPARASFPQLQPLAPCPSGSASLTTLWTTATLAALSDHAHPTAAGTILSTNAPPPHLAQEEPDEPCSGPDIQRRAQHQGHERAIFISHGQA